MTRFTLNSILYITCLTFCLVALSLAFPIGAAEKIISPVGVWKTIDDNTGKARSHIQIWKHKGKLYGKILKLLEEADPNPICDKCPGKRKNQPVKGMIIMPGLTRDGDEWKGRVLDPESGNWYKVQIELQEGGSRLKVRGYIGISLLGRTQYWQRLR